MSSSDVSVGGLGKEQMCIRDRNEAQKSADMFNKCQYLDEITGGKGITFATGTPISNSMTELYVMQRYLQNSKLQNMGLGLFDSWASTFGERCV